MKHEIKPAAPADNDVAWNKQKRVPEFAERAVCTRDVAVIASDSDQLGADSSIENFDKDSRGDAPCS